jgi:hypothetical protein
MPDLSPKKNSESFDENWRNGERFSKFGQFCDTYFFDFSAYALNLKALIKVSKVSWTSQLSYEILRSSFERKFDKTNFISPKKPSQKPASFRVNGDQILSTYCKSDTYIVRTYPFLCVNCKYSSKFCKSQAILIILLTSLVQFV